MDVGGHRLTLTLDRVSSDGEVRLAVSATEPETRLLLRTLLVTEATLVAQGGEELNVLEHGPARNVDDVALRAWTARLEELLSTPKEAPPAIATTWWVKRANFGDLIGPVLVRALTGRPVVHSKYAATREPALFTAGSVLTFPGVPGSRVWGSGLIRPLTKQERLRMSDWRPPTLSAVRGRLTGEQLRTHLGWEVPEVFGDPALLAPAISRLPPGCLLGARSSCPTACTRSLSPVSRIFSTWWTG